MSPSSSTPVLFAYGTVDTDIIFETFNFTQFSVTAAAPVPELSTWVMMLLGFAGLEFAGYRTSRKAVSIAA